MTDIELTLPYPPSVNHYWDSRAVISKKTRKPVVIKYLSARAKSFRDQCAVAVHEQLGKPPKLKHRLAVIVYQHYGPPRGADHGHAIAQDIDNCLKPLFDALEWCGVYVNDSQIDELLVVKKRRAAVGRVDIVIKSITGD
jgi:crossover junction endodeoxyribonuclease RusA